MKKLILASIVLSLLSGCGQIQPTAFATRALEGNEIVRDMGFQGGRSFSIHLAVPQDARSIQAVSSFTGWTSKDIYQYDLTLSDVTVASSPKALATFPVVCKEGKAKALFTNLKPGLKYQIQVVAKGNKGGTAATTVLNTQMPALGYLDLTSAAPDSGAVELTTTITVQLDGAYERTGVVGIVPLDGNTISNRTEAGQGACDTCADDLITTGTTTYDSTFAGGTNGDVFNPDEFHNNWTNQNNGWGWIQREFDDVYDVSTIHIRHAYADLRYAPCSEIYVFLRQTDGSWVTVDHLTNTNLHFYNKTLSTPIKATAFRLVMTDANGWLSASGIALLGAHSETEEDKKWKKDHDDNGHGNDPGHFDPSNPGKAF